MRIKLDENLPGEVEHLFAAASHDVKTVVHQGMGGADDEKLSSVTLYGMVFSYALSAPKPIRKLHLDPDGLYGALED